MSCGSNHSHEDVHDVNIRDHVNDVIYNIFGSESEDEASFGNHESVDMINVWINADIVDQSSDELDGRTEHAMKVLERYGPQSGMMFPTLQLLYEAYKSYAKVQGFCVFARKTVAGKYSVIACGRGGKDIAKKHTKIKNCPARLNAIKQPTGDWMVSTVCLDHNHDLDPNMSALMSGHQNLSLNMKRQLEVNDIAGIRPCKNVRLMEVLAGGPKNIGATVKDCRNFIDERRRLRLGEGDAEAIRQLFNRLQKNDRRFFHLMDIHDHLRLRNVMWVHPRNIAAYQDFHDVISFDTTYLVNQYKMPLATVIGVNHHNQSILLGCGLLTHENAESFKWFFSNWLVAMGGVYPTTILTDQCDSIRIVVREVMLDIVHRLCLWHIAQKIPIKLKDVVDYKRCIENFYMLIYDSLSIADFEKRWAEFLVEYALQNNRWLKDLYVERGNWVPIFLNHLFWAGMVSTQRSESMRAFSDGFVHARSILKTFVEQYEESRTLTTLFNYYIKL